jgi:hypothetical protein
MNSSVSTDIHTEYWFTVAKRPHAWISATDICGRQHSSRLNSTRELAVRRHRCAHGWHSVTVSDIARIPGSKNRHQLNPGKIMSERGGFATLCELQHIANNGGCQLPCCRPSCLVGRRPFLAASAPTAWQRPSRRPRFDGRRMVRQQLMSPKTLEHGLAKAETSKEGAPRGAEKAVGWAIGLI